MMRHSSRLASSSIFAASDREYMTHHPKVHSTPSPDMAGSFFSAEKPNSATSPYYCSTYYMAPPCFFCFFFQEDLLSISESLRQKSPTHTHTHTHSQPTNFHPPLLFAFVSPSLVDWRTASQGNNSHHYWDVCCAFAIRPEIMTIVLPLIATIDTWEKLNMERNRHVTFICWFFFPDYTAV